MPAFPTFETNKVHQVFDYLRLDIDISSRALFKKNIFNLTATYFGDELMQSNENYREVADTFALHWERASKFKSAEFDEAPLVNLYVDKHFKENLHPTALI